MLHHYYMEPNIDLGKTREDAAMRAAGKWIYKTDPESSIIHHHSADQSCEGNRHEQFEVTQTASTDHR